MCNMEGNLCTIVCVAVLFIKFSSAQTVCGGNFSQVEGVIQSPGYPEKYPSNVECNFYIEAKLSIEFRCDSFHLERPVNGTCGADFLMILSNDFKQKFCGEEVIKNIYFSNQLEIVFKSDNENEFSGFSCQFASLNETFDQFESSNETFDELNFEPEKQQMRRRPGYFVPLGPPPPPGFPPPPRGRRPPFPPPGGSRPLFPPPGPQGNSQGSTSNYLSQSGSYASIREAGLAAYRTGVCNRPLRACGCTGVTLADSEYYTSIEGNYRIVISNGIPSHPYEVGQRRPNPNKACKHPVYMAIPLNPQRSSTYRAHGMGSVGIAISAGFFYNHLSTPNGDVAAVREGESFDTCNGHSDPSCAYHYHKMPVCIRNGAGCSFVGYMRDGFPVYSFCKHPTKNMSLRSCYYRTSGDGSHSSHYTFSQASYNNGNCDLDMANGYTFSDNRGYAYIFTEDYPFIMAGYYGSESARLCYF